MKIIASVPYADNASYDFYEDRMMDGEVEYLYDEIDGYGFSLTHHSTSIYYVPVSKSADFIFIFEVAGQVYHLKGRSGGVMSFKNEKVQTNDLIFSELYKCVQTLIAPVIVKKCIDTFANTGRLSIDTLTITNEGIEKKQFFKSKILPFDQYHRTEISQGRVYIYSTKGKLFYNASTEDINAPLLGYILDILLGREI